MTIVNAKEQCVATDVVTGAVCGKPTGKLAGTTGVDFDCCPTHRDALASARAATPADPMQELAELRERVGKLERGVKPA